MTKPSEFVGIPLSEETGIGALTLSRLIADVGEQFAHREAISWQDLDGISRHWTYAELVRASKAVASSLVALGLSKGTRVGILISNRPEWLFSLFGAAMAGAVTVALNTFSTRDE